MKDLTRGPVGRHVLQLALFIALSTAFQTLYFLADLYFVGRLGKEAVAGVGLAENIMSGRVVVDGSASQSAGATGHGGLVVIRGDASARAGISMKGVDIVVQGSVGHMSAFMAQKGRLAVGYDDHRDVFLMKLRDGARERDLAIPVETRVGLVEHDQRGLAIERSREADALPLPA